MTRAKKKQLMKIQLFGEKLASIQEQHPIVENTNINSKDKVPRTTNLLEGYIGNSWNGGMIKPIAWKKIMAGEEIDYYAIQGIIRMLTPKVPVAQKLKTIFKCFFVPDSRIWDNSAKYQAQRGGKTISKIKKTPHLTTSDAIPLIEPKNTEQSHIILTDTTAWRDSYISSYIPRLETGYTKSQPTTPEKFFYNYDIRKLRGFKAIYNEFLRHKKYDELLTEYKTDSMTISEYNSYMPTEANKIRQQILRGRRQASYYTDYRTELEGVNNTIDPMYKDLMEHNEWQKLIAESRSQAENEQLRDIDIIAKIRNAPVVKDGEVQFLGMKEIGMNYTQISQTTYNANQEIQEEFQTLGATGAYSFTQFNIPMINYHKFKEDGYIHIIAQTTADTIFETGLDRLEMNVEITDEYRPDLKDLKEDILYNKELGTNNSTSGQELKAIGFKRKYNEYFKLPNIINGDITTMPIYDCLTNTKFKTEDNPLLTKQEFQFFEMDAQNEQRKNNLANNIIKDIWRDYTDILINKNQAITQPLELIEQNNGSLVAITKGQNQLFMIGTARCITNLPIDNKIKDNFKKWGEA